MEYHKENIDRLTLKIKVLENRILKLQEISEQVLSELNSEYNQQINELNKNKETAQEILNKIRIVEIHQKG